MSFGLPLFVGGLVTGLVSFADAFQVLPLGIGPDSTPGYPLVTFYLAGKDLRAGMELSAAADVVGGDNVLQVSGLEVHYNPAGAAFNRITSLKIGGTTVGLTDTAPCYRVTTTLYVAGLLGVVAQATGGALSVVAKEADCTTVVTDMNAHIVRAGVGTTPPELKAWQAFIKYLGGQPLDNGVPALPAMYATPQGRVVTP